MAIEDWSRQALPAMLDDIRTLVELETPSHDRPALARGLTAVRELTAERLGPPDGETRHDGGRYGDVLELRYAGTAPDEVLLLGHYDTVWPAGTLAGWPFAIEDGTMTGPGVFDMKAGLVQAIWAVRGLRALGLPHPGVRFLFNGDEEIGSPASRPRVEAACADAVATLVFEPSLRGALKTSRKGVGVFDVTVTGVEAHAGLDPAAGASAVHALAELVTRLAAAGAPERGTTVNVGLISGGTGRNVAAGLATCGVDVRVGDPAEMARIDELFAGLRAADPRVTVSVAGEWNRPPMTPNPPSRRLFKEARAVAAAQGWELAEAAVGGASDGNFVSALGRAVLDGFGAVGDGAHARHEHVLVGHVPERTALTIGLISALA
ncbi:M20 family metallopeptidase [Nonomuraea sp. MCN248]|uniref:M20 family metallopeptidase n=1 Tax=Nonomuraea corallina TaxID=2989783 RepID=A0ABT4SJ38_9ACTN|nr:M20 family metallopeptidase [Nonomuraea corallina]MDA0636941.1 M20 family metallopeptidase [Nonomuraea corallina]